MLKNQYFGDDKDNECYLDCKQIIIMIDIDETW